MLLFLLSDGSIVDEEDDTEEEREVSFYPRFFKPLVVCTTKRVIPVPCFRLKREKRKYTVMKTTMKMTIRPPYQEMKVILKRKMMKEMKVQLMEMPPSILTSPIVIH